MKGHWFGGLAVVVAAGWIACASTPKSDTQASPRVKDSVPERAAAQRSASKNLELDADDDRWGIEAARARKDEVANKKANSVVIPLPPMTAPDAGS
jgi:hypothetical protein